MTTLTAPLHHLVDAPTDYRRRTRRTGSTTHRFPAATYLCRRVAREERAIAQEALDATDRAASRRIGALGLVMAALFGGVLFMLATGRTTASGGVLTLWVLGGAMVVAIVGLVAVLRRHEREHDTLTERVRMYDARLVELRALR
jgi:hypothetical protein